MYLSLIKKSDDYFKINVYMDLPPLKCVKSIQGKVSKRDTSTLNENFSILKLPLMMIYMHLFVHF